MAKTFEKPVEVLVAVTQILDDLRVNYFISGGYAVVFLSQPRFTADIDIVINLEEKKVFELAEKLKKELPEAYVDEQQMNDALSRSGEFNIIEPTLGLKIDFFILKNTEYDKLMLRRATKKDLGRSVRFISPEDLIVSKLKWYKLDQSSRHLDDIRSIIKMNKIDEEYLSKWVKEFGLDKVLKKASK